MAISLPWPKRLCRCGDHEVTTTDLAWQHGPLLVVHGRDYCYTVARYEAALALRR